MSAVSTGTLRIQPIRTQNITSSKVTMNDALLFKVIHALETNVKNRVISKLIFNSLAPGWCGNNFESKIVKLITENSSLGIHCEIASREIPQNSTNEKSTLVQVMACCRQATSHYLSQCWLRFMLPYSITWYNDWSMSMWYENRATFSRGKHPAHEYALEAAYPGNLNKQLSLWIYISQRLQILAI